MKAPFDGRFKLLAEEYPDLLLRLLGVAVEGTPVDILRELQLDPVLVDHVYRVGEGAAARLVHFEAVTSWRSKRIPLLALYHFLLRHKFKLRVESYVLLMARKYVPKTLPDRIMYEEDDGLRIETPYRVIRLWEIDPAIAFQAGCEPLLTWVPLLKGGLAEFQRAAERIEELLERPGEAPYRVEAMVSDIAALAVLVYDKDTISRLLERLRRKTMLTTDLFVDTWLYKDGVAAGVAVGKAEGKAEGEAHGILDGKRQSLRLALKKRFPMIGTAPEIDRVDGSEALDNLLLAILEAETAGDAQAAIHAALRTN